MIYDNKKTFSSVSDTRALLLGLVSNTQITTGS